MSDSGGVFKVEPVEFAVGLGVGCVVAGRAGSQGFFAGCFRRSVAQSCPIVGDPMDCVHPYPSPSPGAGVPRKWASQVAQG